MRAGWGCAQADTRLELRRDDGQVAPSEGGTTWLMVLVCEELRRGTGRLAGSTVVVRDARAELPAEGGGAVLRNSGP